MNQLNRYIEFVVLSKEFKGFYMSLTIPLVALLPVSLGSQ